MSTIEIGKVEDATRMLRDDELDPVSGGVGNFRFEMGGLPCSRVVAFDAAKNEVSIET